MLENVNLSVTAPAEENSGDISGGDVEGVRGVLDQLFGACVEDLLTGDDSVFQTTGESAYIIIHVDLPLIPFSKHCFTEASYNYACMTEFHSIIFCLLQ